MVTVITAASVLALAWGPSGEDIAYLAPRAADEADVDVRLFRWTVGSPDPAELASGWDRSLGSTVRSDDGRGTGPPALAWSAATGRIYFTVADGGRAGWAGRTPRAVATGTCPAATGPAWTPAWAAAGA